MAIRPSSILAVFIALALSAALYHILAIFIELDEAPVWRHLVFMLVNLFLVFGLLERPKYFLIFLVILTIQQYYSHGSYLIKLWNEQGEIHWISVAVLVLLPVLVVVYAGERSRK